jgi:23S rRNA (guanosine2251-2'-O)-methyltransferase
MGELTEFACFCQSFPYSPHMKNNKQSRSDRSPAPFRASAEAGKPFQGGASSSTRDDHKKAYSSQRTKKFYSDETKPRRFDDERKPKKSFTKGFKAKAPLRSAGKPEHREIFKPAGDNVLIWGLHAARAAWLNPKRRITRAWLTEAGQKSFALTQKEALDELLKRPDAKKCEREELDRMMPTGSVHQGIVIETTPVAERSLHDIIGANPPPDLLLMLDQVTDPHNVGAILRSAAAFGAGAVIMTERNAPATTGVLAKSASGALEATPIVHVVNLARSLDELRDAGYWCVGLAEEGEKHMADLDLSGRTVIVLGAEGDGLRHLTRQKCDELARLPTGAAMGTLNVSNAAAIALYEVRRQAK